MADSEPIAADSPASTAKPSAVEVAKLASDYLKGDIPKELVDGGRSRSWSAPACPAGS